MADIYTFITDEEAGYQKPISLENNWWWSMKEHIRLSYLYKNSQFEVNNEDRDKRPFKNIVRPILNVQYRTEGFDVKDIEIYVNNPENYHKSFLIKKYHDKWALENEIDTFIDSLVESYVDYGGVLVKHTDKPEVVDLRTIAFCDQTNILSGPFAIKHFMTPGEIRDMKGWGDPKKGATISVEELILRGETKKQQDKQDPSSETPGNYVEVYEVHGILPDNEDNDNEVAFVSFYKDSNDQKVGVTLFRNKEPKLPFKFLSRDPVQGRALGFGGVEELFEAQVWTNFSELQIMGMLEMASKVFFKTNDPRFKTRNNLINADNGQVFDLQEGKDINQLDVSPRNLPVFNDSMDRWEEHAGRMGAAGDAVQGETPPSGTPFKLFEAQVIEGKSLHLWRQGKIATFVDEIYRDWIIPKLGKEVTQEKTFMTILSSEEVQEISEKIAAKKVGEAVKEAILSGKLITNQLIQESVLKVQEQVLRGGSKRFLKIVKDDFKDDELEVMTNIAGKQKDLALLTDKLVNVLRQFISTPEIRQDPGMVKLLNTILESSGMSPLLFSVPPQAQVQGTTEPLEELSNQQRPKEPIGQ